MIFINGDSCDGDWVSDIQHGSCTYIWQNGNKYIGERRNN